MSDVLTIIDSLSDYAQLPDELSRRHPDRVTLLVDQPAGELDELSRDRLARLMADVERRTGALVVGIAGSREQLEGWRFDAVVHAPQPAPALT